MAKLWAFGIENGARAVYSIYFLSRLYHLIPDVLSWAHDQAQKSLRTSNRGRHIRDTSNSIPPPPHNTHKLT